MEEERRNILKQDSENAAKTSDDKNQLKKNEKETKKKQNSQKSSLPENVSGAVHKFLTDDYEDEDVVDEDMRLKGDEDQVGMKVDGKTRTTIRNLRIREDTAKYLINLDPESAFYDPKTRSMRANPLPHKDPSQLEFAGDNFSRFTGHAKEFQELQNYSMDANEKGQAVHMQAAPSQSELLHKEFTKRKENLLKQQQKKILEQYGGEEHLKAPSKELLLGQTETYVEYGQDGKLVNGSEKVVLSKWEEDIHPGNHTSIWGSFWSNGKWGYSCCYQMEKNAYCLGEAGKKAHKMSSLLKEKREQQSKNDNTSTISNIHNITDKKSSSDDKKLPIKRKYNSLESCEVTDEDMEEYRRKRQRTEDPMADYFN